ncbi:hypothetical protein GCM10007079_45290 [Nocardiopsis terrae]|uniref:Uncharacterized protein n=1 Tax=Nocardiopsis terrae TaxID=372655 RepID=A0ABR9HKV6_9ACTN|nr:hypothetical protein [Nocardiopsis terrae]MBE1459661.1 hypothetical protein [Nocardiopsis terrae]GHC94632.1 hypothetical protein GCM10007079_45290 [Nocardiopsis terrae]
MADERCLHELLPDQCGLCKPVPSGLAARVVITAGGSVFHRDTSCEALVEGRNKAFRLGLELHDPVTVPIDRIVHDRPPCIHCFPDYAPPGTRLCWVMDDGTWNRGLLKRWTVRGADGLWRAEVDYVVDRVPREAVLDQRRLRPREPGEQRPRPTVGTR